MIDPNKQQGKVAGPLGVGAQFLQSIMQPVAQPQVEQIQQRVEKYKKTLSDSGFKVNSENLDKFIKNNPNIEDDVYDFAGLSTQGDKQEVPAVRDIIKDAFLNVPVVSVLKGLVKPLQILGEGFSRYEAMKTEFLSQFPAFGPAAALTPEVSDSFKGQAKSKFPDAKLKTSDMPELGDFFRQLGLPEEISASAGLALDILTDIPIGGGITEIFGAGAKGTKATLPKLSKYLTPEMKESITKFRSQRWVQEIEDAAKGKSRYADLTPETQNALRAASGEQHSQTWRASRLGGMLKQVTKNDQKVLNLVSEALEGDAVAFNGLDKSTQAVTTAIRKLIDRQSNLVAKEIQTALDQPEVLENLAKRMGVIEEGKKLPPEQLVDIINKNKGSYVKRFYEIYLDKNYKPSAQVIENAKKGLSIEFGKTEKEAADIVEDILKNKEVRFKSGTRDFKIDDGSFIARKEIPQYLRKLMGEVENPIFNSVQTIKHLTETGETFKLYRKLVDEGLFSKQASKTFSMQVPEKGPLAWGMIDGKYTTPEVHALLTHIKDMTTAQDRWVINMMQGLKGVKTVGNVKTHLHNVMGNMFFSYLDGVSPVTHSKLYKEAIDILGSEVLTKKGKRVAGASDVFKELVKNGVIKNEFPNANEVRWLQELVDNPYSFKEHGITGKTFQEIAKGATKLYSWEDQLFKVASYLHKTRTLKQTPQDAVKNIYKWYPNYIEATRLADRARNSAAGLFMLNPFLTFRVESHRIMLNAFKDPATRMKAALILGHNMAFNSALLAFQGQSMQDISELFLTRPEAVSEVLLNPLSKDLSLNEKYLNPFNTAGIFAPLMALSGATGVNPLDYVLDFTQFSPDFGYSNLITNSLEPALVGKDRFGQPISFMERVQETVKGLGPTSFTRDLPGIFSKENDGTEKLMRGLRFFGVDVEKRNPKWIKNQVQKRLDKKVQNKENIQPTLNAIKTLGFDVDSMLKNSLKKNQVNKKPVQAKKGQIEKAFDMIEKDEA